jgi:hypothetical protein
MVLYLCVLIVFSFRRELLKLILVPGDEPLSEVVLSHLVWHVRWRGAVRGREWRRAASTVAEETGIERR